LGRQYTKILGDGVVRVCLALELGVEEPVLRSMAGKVAPEELEKFKKALEQRMEESFPIQTQLLSHREELVFDSEYMI